MPLTVAVWLQPTEPVVRRERVASATAGVWTFSVRLAPKPVPHANGVQRTSPAPNAFGAGKRPKKSCALQGRRPRQIPGLNHYPKTWFIWPSAPKTASLRLNPRYAKDVIGIWWASCGTWTRLLWPSTQSGSGVALIPGL